MGDLILCSEAIAIAVQQGLTLHSAVEAFRKAVDNTTFGIWGRRHVTIYATCEGLSQEWQNPNDKARPVEFQHVPYWSFPETDDEGFAAVVEESGDITVATAWPQDLLVYNELTRRGLCRVSAPTIGFI